MTNPDAGPPLVAFHPGRVDAASHPVDAEDAHHHHEGPQHLRAVHDHSAHIAVPQVEGRAREEQDGGDAERQGVAEVLPAGPAVGAIHNGGEREAVGLFGFLFFGHVAMAGRQVAHTKHRVDRGHRRVLVHLLAGRWETHFGGVVFLLLI